MAIERRADADWEGNLLEGSGRVELSSSEAASLPVTWASRVESPDGRTSPEELVAAAHAACYAMAFSHYLNNSGTPSTRLHVTAVVTFSPKEGGGFYVSDSALDVRGVVPGMDQAAFQAAAEEGEKGCPISNALRGNVNITVEATLQDG
jgi:osmotically inducible protein OsmC